MSHFISAHVRIINQFLPLHEHILLKLTELLTSSTRVRSRMCLQLDLKIKNLEYSFQKWSAW